MSAQAVARRAGPLSERELRRNIAQAQRADAKPILLYYGSLEDGDVLQVQVYGQRFRINPDAYVVSPEGVDEKMDGTFLLKDIVGVAKWDRKASLNPNPPMSIRFKAEDLAASMLAQRQERGLVQLTGDPKEDAAIKLASTATWVQWRRKGARHCLTTFKKEQAAQHSAGLSPDPMGDREMLAQRFLEDDQNGVYRAYMQVVSPFAFTCKERENGVPCGRVEKDAKRFQSHLAITHKLSEADIRAKYLDDEPEQDPENEQESTKQERPPAPAGGKRKK